VLESGEDAGFTDSDSSPGRTLVVTGSIFINGYGQFVDNTVAARRSPVSTSVSLPHADVNNV
jgi:hypothetical protein